MFLCEEWVGGVGKCPRKHFPHRSTINIIFCFLYRLLKMLCCLLRRSMPILRATKMKTILFSRRYCAPPCVTRPIKGFSESIFARIHFMCVRFLLRASILRCVEAPFCVVLRPAILRSFCVASILRPFCVASILRCVHLFVRPFCVPFCVASILPCVHFAFRPFCVHFAFHFALRPFCVLSMCAFCCVRPESFGVIF